MKKKQILVVEDERIVADDIKMSLQRLGYVVSGMTSSGEEAVRFYQKIRLSWFECFLKGLLNE